MNAPTDGTIHYCGCKLAPEDHVHVLSQGELDNARHAYPHIWIVHSFICRCTVCVINSLPLAQENHVH